MQNEKNKQISKVDGTTQWTNIGKCKLAKNMKTTGSNINTQNRKLKKTCKADKTTKTIKKNKTNTNIATHNNLNFTKKLKIGKNRKPRNDNP